MELSVAETPSFPYPCHLSQKHALIISNSTNADVELLTNLLHVFDYCCANRTAPHNYMQVINDFCQSSPNDLPLCIILLGEASEIGPIDGRGEFVSIQEIINGPIKKYAINSRPIALFLLFDFIANDKASFSHLDSPNDEKVKLDIDKILPATETMRTQCFPLNKHDFYNSIYLFHSFLPFNSVDGEIVNYCGSSFIKLFCATIMDNQGSYLNKFVTKFNKKLTALKIDSRILPMALMGNGDFYL